MLTFTIRGGPHRHARGVPGVWGDIKLDYEVMNANDIFSAMLKRRPYEICEFSLANYLMLASRGETWVRALPIFPNRAFRHGTLTVRKDSPLNFPGQLAGCRIGVEDYSMSAAVWVRGLLYEQYQVSHRDLTWVTPPDQRFPPPGDVRMEFRSEDLEELLAAGDVDVIIGMHLADSKLPTECRRFRTLLPDAEAAEVEYYARTGIYPINHCVVVREDVLALKPRLPEVLISAYEYAKSRAYGEQADSSRPPWAECAPHAAFARSSADPLLYSLTPVNRHVVITLAKELQRQGFIEHLPDIDGSFLPMSAPSEFHQPL